MGGKQGNFFSTFHFFLGSTKEVNVTTPFFAEAQRLLNRREINCCRKICIKVPGSTFLSTDVFAFAPLTVHYPFVLVLTFASVFCFYTLLCSSLLSTEAFESLMLPNGCSNFPFCSESQSGLQYTVKIMLKKLISLKLYAQLLLGNGSDQLY